MAFIKISELNTAESNSSANTDSFLTELAKTDSRQIFGGHNRGGGNRRKDIVVETTPYCCKCPAPTPTPPREESGIRSSVAPRRRP